MQQLHLKPRHNVGVVCARKVLRSSAPTVTSTPTRLWRRSSWWRKRSSAKVSTTPSSWPSRSHTGPTTAINKDSSLCQSSLSVGLGTCKVIFPKSLKAPVFAARIFFAVEIKISGTWRFYLRWKWFRSNFFRSRAVTGSIARVQNLTWRVQNANSMGRELSVTKPGCFLSWDTQLSNFVLGCQPRTKFAPSRCFANSSRSYLKLSQNIKKIFTESPDNLLG